MPDGGSVNGWCYIDPTANIGSQYLVTNCSGTEDRKIRFVGAGFPRTPTSPASRQTEPALLPRAGPPVEPLDMPASAEAPALAENVCRARNHV